MHTSVLNDEKDELFLLLWKTDAEKALSDPKTSQNTMLT